MKKTLIALAPDGRRQHSTPWPQDIVDTAVKAGNFKTLVAASAGGWSGGHPQGPGPFTVFCAH